MHCVSQQHQANACRNIQRNEYALEDYNNKMVGLAWLKEAIQYSIKYKNNNTHTGTAEV